MENLISIIVPVYNVKALLARCIESLINQTYGNIEIIIVDDGSTDGSEKECDKYIGTDKRIRVYHKKNGGLSDARNYGMSVAKGQYFLFVDSDDVVNKRFCEILIKQLIENNADIVSTDIFDFWQEKELEQLEKKEAGQIRILKNDNILKEYFMPKEKRIINHGLCMKIYKRELFDNLVFDVGRLHEDLFITHKLLKRCKCFVYVDVPYYYYYQKNTNSISNNYSEKNFLDEYDCIKQIYETYRKNENLNEDLICFCCYHYLFMLNRIYKDKKRNKIRETEKEIHKWIICNVWKTKSIGRSKKVKIVFGAYFPQVYFELRRKRNET